MQPVWWSAGGDVWKSISYTQNRTGFDIILSSKFRIQVIDHPTPYHRPPNDYLDDDVDLNLDLDENWLPHSCPFLDAEGECGWSGSAMVGE